MRKLGKGDPVSYLRKIDWADLTKQASDLIKEKIVGIRDALLSILNSKATWLLSDAAEASLKKNADQLSAILPKVEQGIKEGMQNIEKRMNKALDEYTGEKPHRGITGDLPQKTRTDELDAPKGNELPGAKPKLIPMKKYKPPCFTPGPDLAKNFKGGKQALEKEFYKPRISVASATPLNYATKHIAS